MSEALDSAPGTRVSHWGCHSVSDSSHERTGADGRGLSTRVWCWSGVETEITVAVERKKIERRRRSRKFPSFPDISNAKWSREELRKRKVVEEPINSNDRL